MCVYHNKIIGEKTFTTIWESQGYQSRDWYLEIRPSKKYCKKRKYKQCLTFTTSYLPKVYLQVDQIEVHFPASPVMYLTYNSSETRASIGRWKINLFPLRARLGAPGGQGANGGKSWERQKNKEYNPQSSKELFTFNAGMQIKYMHKSVLSLNFTNFKTA